MTILPANPDLSPRPAADSPAVRLEAFSYDERRDVLPGVSRALESCGGFVLERRILSATQIELRFEMQIRSALELYSLLLGAGLELTRGSHLFLNGLCTVRQYRQRGVEPFRVLEVFLRLSFLDDLQLAGALLPGAGSA